jgi:hypothetical protein
MRNVLAIFALAFPIVLLAQAVHLKGGATVYIEPMDGYETYLAAALAKKHVSLIVVADKDRAEYIITRTVAAKDAAERRAIGETPTSIAVINPRTSRIVFAYAAGKTRDGNQLQETAEDCAKRLGKLVENP